MPPRSVVSRTYPRVPYAAFGKNGEPLDLGEVIDGIREDAELVTRYALREITETNLALVNGFDRYKPAEAGRRMGLFLPTQVKNRFKSGASRLEKMFQEQTVTALRSWSARSRAASGDYVDYVSAGWKRTVSDSRPKMLQPRLALSAADKQYRRMSVTDERIVLEMVVRGRWVTLYFPTPPQLLEEGVAPSVPDIWIDSQDRVVFGFHGTVDPARPEFSSRYIIGVDVGVTNPATYVVWDSTKEEIVEQSLLSQRARSLHNKIKRTQTQIASLKRQGRDDEAVPHREHLSNRRKELSILIAQEIADTAWRYGNALVVFENLSHISNTMRFGRWFRGEVYRRTRDMLESDGGRALKVHAAYTSQKCYACQTKLDTSNYNNPMCNSCNITHHRDINAAANIAQRANHSKACQTRKRHATKTKRIRRSKCHMKPLKHPGTKNHPTPKAPQNQKKTRTPAPRREVSVRMCPADIRVSAVDRMRWFQTNSGTTNPVDTQATKNTVDVVYPKE